MNKSGIRDRWAVINIFLVLSYHYPLLSGYYLSIIHWRIEVYLWRIIAHVFTHRFFKRSVSDIHEAHSPARTEADLVLGWDASTMMLQMKRRNRGVFLRCYTIWCLPLGFKSYSSG